MAALALFNGVLLPNRLARTFLIPASSKTVRIEPPAITPVPGAAGRIRTLAAPSRPLESVGMELCPWNKKRIIVMIEKEIEEVIRKIKREILIGKRELFKYAAFQKQLKEVKR